MKKIFTTFLLGSLLAPTFTSALSIQNKEELHSKVLMRNTATTSTQTKDRGFCSQIDKILITIEDKNETKETRKMATTTKQTEKRDALRSKLDAKRDENESMRKRQFAELTKRATTTEQKAALATFITVVNQALTVRESAIDEVLLSHRKEVDPVSDARRVASRKAVVKLKSDIETAKNQAKADCKAGLEGDTVRSYLKSSIQQAESTFRATVSSNTQSKDVTTLSNDEKKKQLAHIDETFKKSVAEARNNLKASFKAKVSVSTSTTNQ